MISALRRRLGPSDKEGGPSNVGGSKIPSGVQRVNNELQKKFARGVQYNMKIVVRGDRNVGKSCLLRRLQGMNFIEEYSATEEIQVAAIHWNYKATDDVVKVDVWDVVDQSTKKRVRNSGLKLANNASATEWEEAGCDASFVDVYKGSHGVILVFDLTKLWTWEYVQKEMENVPDNLPILVLANRRDMGHHRVVTEEQIRSFVDQFNSTVCHRSIFGICVFLASLLEGVGDISLPSASHDSRIRLQIAYEIFIIIYYPSKMNPSAPFVIMDLSTNVNAARIPWMTMARHFAAFFLYLLALVQWPGYMVSEWAGDDRVFAYNLTSLMFTLAFWCACLFHYLVSAGRVEVNWRTGHVRAKGWIVKTSRRAHRVLLSLSLAISAMTIIQSTTTTMIITHFYIKQDAPNAKEHAILILLKVDQTLAFFMFVYVLGRLVFEPVSIRKPRRRQNASGTTDSEHQTTSASLKHSSPEDCEECNICTEHWSNRSLSCGHTICCCCLAEIWKAERYCGARCPFCRADVSTGIRKLQVIDCGEVEIGDCCMGTVQPESGNGSSEGSVQTLN